jgi:hypothetical protein
VPIGDIDPRYSINSLASASKLGGNAIPSAFAVLEIDNNLKSHVQQRPPGVIFALGAGMRQHVSYADPGQVRSLF